MIEKSRKTHGFNPLQKMRSMRRVKRVCASLSSLVTCQWALASPLSSLSKSLDIRGTAYIAYGHTDSSLNNMGIDENCSKNMFK